MSNFEESEEKALQRAALARPDPNQLPKLSVNVDGSGVPGLAVTQPAAQVQKTPEPLAQAARAGLSDLQPVAITRTAAGVSVNTDNRQFSLNTPEPVQQAGPPVTGNHSTAAPAAAELPQRSLFSGSGGSGSAPQKSASSVIVQGGRVIGYGSQRAGFLGILRAPLMLLGALLRAIMRMLGLRPAGKRDIIVRR